MKHTFFLIFLIIISIITLTFTYEKIPYKYKKILPYQKNKNVIRLGGVFKENLAFNPFSYHDDNVIVLEFIYSSLMRMNSKGLPENDLAEKIEIAEDSTSIKFFLKKNVKFHNGSTFTAKDVVFSLKLFQNRNLNELNNYHSFIKKTEIINDFEIIFYFNKKLLQPENYFNFPILPNESKKNIIEIFNTPIGTGPFHLYKNDKNAIILKKFASYQFKKSSYDFLIFKKYPTKNSVWSAFMRNEIDFYPFLTYEQHKNLLNSKWSSTKIFSELRYFLLVLNPNSPNLKNIHVRQAINQGINKNEIIKKNFKNQALPISSPAISKEKQFSSYFEFDEYNPSSAIDKLKQAALITLDNTENITFNNKTLSLDLLISDAVSEFKQIAQRIKLQLRKIGITVNIRTCQDIEYKEKRLNKKFDILLDAKPAYISNPLFFKYWLKDVGDTAYVLNNQSDFIKYYEQLTKVKNNNEEIEILSKLCSIIKSESNYIFLCHPIKYYAFNKNIVMPGTNFAYYFNYYDLLKIKINKE